MPREIKQPAKSVDPGPQGLTRVLLKAEGQRQAGHRPGGCGETWGRNSWPQTVVRQGLPGEEQGILPTAAVKGECV